MICCAGEHLQEQLQQANNQIAVVIRQNQDLTARVDASQAEAHQLKIELSNAQKEIGNRKTDIDKLQEAQSSSAHLTCQRLAALTRKATCKDQKIAELEEACKIWQEQAEVRLHNSSP